MELPTLLDKVASFFLSPTRSDVTFVVGEEAKVQSFPGHKFLLSMSSPVFETMFYGPLASDEKEIRLADEDPESFNAVLRYLYTEEAEFNMEIVISTLYSAKKYMLDQLEEKCSTFIIKNLACDNVITMYQQVI
jgi:BTB/POZ domain-containing protein 1/2